MNFTIRIAKESDAQAMVEILRDIGWFEYINLESSEETTERVKQRICLYINRDSHLLYVAESSKNKVSGYAAVHWLPSLFLPSCEGHISELFVHPDSQGYGIGKALLQTVVSEGRKRHCSRLMLLNNRNRESYLHGFYRKQGWFERENMANFVYYL